MKRFCSVLLIVLLLATGPGALICAAAAGGTPTAFTAPGGVDELPDEPQAAVLSLRYEYVGMNAGSTLKGCIPMTREALREIEVMYIHYSTDGTTFAPLWNDHANAPATLDYGKIRDDVYVGTMLLPLDALLVAFEAGEVPRLWFKVEIVGGIHAGLTTPAMLEMENDLKPLPDSLTVETFYPKDMMQHHFDENGQGYFDGEQTLEIPQGTTAEGALYLLPSALNMMVCFSDDNGIAAGNADLPFTVQWAVPETVQALTPGVYTFAEGHILTPEEETEILHAGLYYYSYTPPPTTLALRLVITVTEPREPPVTLPPGGGTENGGGGGGGGGNGGNGGSDGNGNDGGNPDSGEITGGSGGNRGDVGSENSGDGIREDVPQLPAPGPETSPAPAPKQTPALDAAPTRSPVVELNVESTPPVSTPIHTDLDPAENVPAPAPIVPETPRPVPIAAKNLTVAPPVARAADPDSHKTAAILGGIALALIASLGGLIASGAGPHIVKYLLRFKRKIGPMK